MKSRRTLLALAGTIATSGCIRLTSDSEEMTSSGSKDQAPTSVPSTAQRQSTSSTKLSVSEFEPISSFGEGQLNEISTLSMFASGKFVDVSGVWSGDRNIISQAAANYRFELLNGESVLLSSDTRTIIRNYVYKTVQTADSLFITYHSSIERDWEHSLSLMFKDNEYQIDAEVRPDRGVLEYDLSESRINPGRYNWTVQIIPTDSAGQFGLGVSVGMFDEQLIEVKPDRDDFPSRSEAIAEVGAVSNESSMLIQRPDGKKESGMKIVAEGSSGGTVSDYPEGTRYTSRGFSVKCSPDCTFGGETSNRFRMINVTTGASLTFILD